MAERFERGDRVQTPLGPGKFDGYGSPRGRAQPDSMWVWLDGDSLMRFPLDALITPEEAEDG